MSKFAKIFISILIIVSLFVVFLTTKNIENKEEHAYIMVKKGNVENKVLVPGEFLFGKKINLKSKMNGIIKKIYKKAGDSVMKNEVIAEIDMVVNPIEYENTKKSYELSRINYSNIKRKHKVQEKLYQKGVVSRNDYEDSLNSLKIALSELNSSKQSFFISKKGFSKNTENSNKVISPIDGIILEIPFKEGNPVVKQDIYRDGTTVVKVGGLNQLIFSFYVTQSNLFKVNVGETIQINLDSSGEKIEAKISEINYSCVKENNISKYKVVAEVQGNKQINNVSEGFSGYAEIVLEKKNNVLIAEEKAITFKEDSSYVFVKERGEEIVRTGVSDGINTQILGEHLKEGDSLRVKKFF